jgi:hypothetical protein
MNNKDEAIAIARTLTALALLTLLSLVIWFVWGLHL